MSQLLICWILKLPKSSVMLFPNWHRVYQSSQHKREQEGGCSINKGPCNLPTSSHGVNFSSKSRHCAQATKEAKLYATKNSCRSICMYLQEKSNGSDVHAFYHGVNFSGKIVWPYRFGCYSKRCHDACSKDIGCKGPNGQPFEGLVLANSLTIQPCQVPA